MKGSCESPWFTVCENKEHDCHKRG
jgi:hypothetical protein